MVLKTRNLLLYLLLAGLLTAFLVMACDAQKQTLAPAAGSKVEKAARDPVYERPELVNAEQGQQLLEDGNKRYMSGAVMKKDLSQAKRGQLSQSQKPFAVVLSCSDSRVPPELIFDQGLGDLFVVRAAGNVVDPVTLGSIEYGAEHLGATLIVVMGHTHCGAIKASVDGQKSTGSIGAIMAKIKPALDKGKTGGAKGEALYQKVEDENINLAVAEMKKSPVLKHLLDAGKVKIVSAKYNIETGEVAFSSEKSK